MTDCSVFSQSEGTESERLTSLRANLIKCLRSKQQGQTEEKEAHHGWTALRLVCMAKKRHIVIEQ